MYQFNTNIEIDKTEASKKIGLSRPYLTDILNKKISCSKSMAYAITKYLNKDKEISDFFIKVIREG